MSEEFDVEDDADEAFYKALSENWMTRAKTQTLETLPTFLAELSGYDHDYSTIVIAEAAAAIAAVYALDNTPNGGITGFQASSVFWTFLTNYLSEYKDVPLRLQNISLMLYPQYEYRFEKILSVAEWEYLQKEASTKMRENAMAAPEVLKHWQNIVEGKVPFGYTVEKAD